MNTCRIDGCDRGRYQRSTLCVLHHGRRHRYGDPLVMPTPQHLDLVGRTFGHLTVIAHVNGRWLASCDCGSTATVTTYALTRRGVVQNASCGDRREHRRTGSAGYTAAHDRVRQDRGSARDHVCLDCGRPARHWSYDHGDPLELVENGLPYSLKPAHYQPRCVPCHKAFDLTPA